MKNNERSKKFKLKNSQKISKISNSFLDKPCPCVPEYWALIVSIMHKTWLTGSRHSSFYEAN